MATMADKIGQMDQRITLQRATETDNVLGGSDVTWGDLASNPTVWAHVRPLGGREAMIADGVSAEQKHLFTLRNRSDITEADRIVWLGAPFNIRRIEREGTRAKYLSIEAERGVAD